MSCKDFTLEKLNKTFGLKIKSDRTLFSSVDIQSARLLHRSTSDDYEYSGGHFRLNQTLTLPKLATGPSKPN